MAANRIRKTVVEQALERLEEALTAARFDGAVFARTGTFPFGAEAQAFTRDVLSATEEYRQSWIVDPLVTAIAALRDECNREAQP